jgi:hypothetical protein
VLWLGFCRNNNTVDGVDDDHGTMLHIGAVGGNGKGVVELYGTLKC